MINTIVAACLEDVPHAPVSSEPRIVLPAFSRFHTEGLIFHLQVPPCWDLYWQPPDLERSKRFHLAEHPDAYSPVSENSTGHPSAHAVVHMGQSVCVVTLEACSWNQQSCRALRRCHADLLRADEVDEEGNLKPKNLDWPFLKKTNNNIFISRKCVLGVSSRIVLF